jgi:hypothetical protein
MGAVAVKVPGAADDRDVPRFVVRERAGERRFLRLSFDIHGNSEPHLTVFDASAFEISPAPSGRRSIRSSARLPVATST